METNIVKWQKRLKQDQAELKKQLKEVTDKYPLVAFSYHLQSAFLAKAQLGALELMELGTFSGTISPLDLDLVIKTTAEMNKAISDFDACLGRSTTYEEGLSCCSHFSSHFH